ncbi:hypothetical protein BCON_0605g00010 [Botryotinia convoluta]|uniref:Uncharacterized protein n=1 Tax=Botryotinia convoluta TaxID=54673 RepID=A0A4Z1H4L5_9HELO|nr:hypothetical protein BCON_0605g00010 [Botryotinia convoluta]
MSFTSVQPEISGLEAMRQLKRDHSGKGCVMVGHDGVCRSFDGDRNVVDAIGLSPRQIKELLDRTEWTQEIEDRFRGIDGRNVTDHKALFDPEDDLRPRKFTEDDKLKIKKHNEELQERIEQEKRDGVNVAEKYACGKQKSDYNLDDEDDNKT